MEKVEDFHWRRVILHHAIIAKQHHDFWHFDILTQMSDSNPKRHDVGFFGKCIPNILIKKEMFSFRMLSVLSQ